MFETQYNEEMEAEARKLDAKQRSINAGHPEWDNACKVCNSRILNLKDDICEICRAKK